MSKITGGKIFSTAADKKRHQLTATKMKLKPSMK